MSDESSSQKKRPKKFITAILAVIAVIVFIVLFAAAGSSSNKTSDGAASTFSDTSSTSASGDTSTPPAPVDPYPHFGNGTFLVGSDIQPGTYRTRQGSPSCYWERAADLTGGIDSILANDNTDYPTVVTIAASDKAFISKNCGTWTQDLSAITDSKTTFGDGIFIVGTDMQPGTYKSSGQTGCYWSRLSSFGGSDGGILANDNTDTQAIVTILASDKGFESKRCGTWTLVQ